MCWSQPNKYYYIASCGSSTSIAYVSNKTQRRHPLIGDEDDEDLELLTVQQYMIGFVRREFLFQTWDIILMDTRRSYSAMSKRFLP